jgi:hypothetical protein
MMGVLYYGGVIAAPARPSNVVVVQLCLLESVRHGTPLQRSVLAFICGDRATTTTTLLRIRGSAGLATICSSHTTLCALVVAGPLGAALHMIHLLHATPTLASTGPPPKAAVSLPQWFQLAPSS